MHLPLQHFDFLHFFPKGNKNVTTNDVLSLLSFPTLQATKMRQQSHNIHQNNISSILPALTLYTIRESNRNTRSAAYFVLIYCKNLL